LGALLLTLAWGTPSNDAGAATATTTFQVVANVLVTCTISATEMNFGDYTGLRLTAQSELLVKCTNTAQWTVGLNQGTGPGATVTTRQMTGPPPFFLNYSLSSDAAGTVNWGNTVGTDTVAGTGTGTAQAVSVFGVLPAGQSIAGPGGYADTIIATITF
jgi:spore coat protein U-like protein